MSERAEQLILEYLGRVGDASRVSLRTDQRLDFLRRLRSRIEEYREAAGATEPEQVRKVLARFGDPAALVARERDRLRSPDGDPAGGVSAAKRVTSSMEEAAATLDEDPKTEPIPVVRAEPPHGRDDTGAGSAPAPGGSTGGGDGTGPAAGNGVQGPRQTPRKQPAAGSTARFSTPQARPRHSGPPLYEPGSPRKAGRDVPPAVSGLFEQLPPEVRRALRSGAVEGAGIVLVGVGGALLPLPLWFVGAVLVGAAGAWTVQDKLLGLLPPPLLAAVGSVGVAGAERGAGSRIEAYLGALAEHGWPLFGIGAVIGAVYLLVRLVTQARRNRRGGRPPWQRTNPNAR